ncbi:ABC transporter permease [Promicromonospora sp. NFX87]|uniref:ABC transporter permease n=1 Tax=Promicromonospora sp. NFX87 TaxID=3402691 RepID=UPI003AFB1750
MSALLGIAVADFRERTRRPAYLVTLAAAIGLGWLAIPPADSVWVVMNAGGYRGLYDGAWVGTVTALAGGLWLMLGGFYVVRGTITRDRLTGVGQVLAATPLSRPTYLLGKLLSNFLVLASMAGVLAGTALALQIARGESYAVDPVALLAPFALFTLPVLAVTSAAAVLFETVRPLRAGLGNIVWFFVWTFLLLGSGGVPFGGFGLVVESMRASVVEQGLPPAGGFSLGLTGIDEPLRVFDWDGLAPTGELVAGRLLVLLAAVLVAVLPALWFDRFDVARAAGATRVAVDAGLVRAGELPASAAAAPQVVGSVGVGSARVASLTVGSLTAAPAGRRPALARMVAGELRVLTSDLSWWWWLVVAGLNVAAVAWDGPGTAMLAAAWIWPVLVWSRLGTQHLEHGLDTLLGAYPGSLDRTFAQWLAGVALTAATAVGPLASILLDGDAVRAAHWAAGALFIPSLALLLGTVTRTPRVFQVLYLIAWYMAINDVAAFDHMGIVLDAAGHPAGASAVAVGGAALGLTAAALAVRRVQHVRR